MIKRRMNAKERFVFLIDLCMLHTLYAHTHYRRCKITPSALHLAVTGNRLTSF